MAKKAKEIRVRLAPSPTGVLHLGTARTALFNYLFARKNKGKFILRIEDTDFERSKSEYEKEILQELRWLGIEWDEGPDIGGSFEPYRQSERIEIYKKYLEKLIGEKKAYYCFCSPEELEEMKNYYQSLGKAPKYSGKCADLPEKEVKKMIAEGKPYVIRFRVPEKKISFKDLIRGKIEFDAALFGDIVIAKNFLQPLYNFAAVVDDYEMKISHVIRGEDHLSNTPKQIFLQKALGFDKIQYAHIPLILGSDRSKLSKRHGATAVSSFRKDGYLPEAICNFLALLGWNPGDDREIFSLKSLIKEFSLEKIQKSGAVFNSARLDWINGFYIRNKKLSDLVELILPYWFNAGIIRETDFKNKYLCPETNEIIDNNYLKIIIQIYQTRIKKLSEIVVETDFFFKEIEYEKDLLKWKENSFSEIKKQINNLIKILSGIDDKDWNREEIEKTVLKETNKLVDRGLMLWPLRVALTGKKGSAGSIEISSILGKQKTIERLEKANVKIGA
jgi:glutamyl-tRNA synthetase